MAGISNLQVGASNAYFFKLDNQNWSTTDYCYIETAARRHPDFNVKPSREIFDILAFAQIPERR